MPTCRGVSCVAGRQWLLWPVRSLEKTLVSLCHASFCTPRPNLTWYSRYLLTYNFCIPVPYDDKDYFFCCQFLKVFQVFIESFNFRFFCISGWGTSSVQSLSHVQFFDNPWTAACQASLSTINSQCLLKLMFIESLMQSNHLILCHSLLLLPSIFPSIRVFSNESVCHIRWPKYWSFSFSISPSNEYSGLIPFRIDWLDLLAVHQTHKSLLQHHRSKASIIWHSAFFMVQLSHTYMTAWQPIALNRWTFVRKVISLLFSMLSRLVTAFLPRSNCLLISWLQSPSAVILEPPPQIKSLTVSIVFDNCDWMVLEVTEIS